MHGSSQGAPWADLPWVAMSTIDMSTRRRRGSLLIEVSGDVDLDAARALARRAAGELAKGHLDIVLDLRDVELLDSTGLAVLLNLNRRLIRRRGRLRLICGPDVVRSLELTRLDQEFRVYRNPREALAA